MEVSGERHAPAALPRAEPSTPWIVAGWFPAPVWMFWEGKSSWLCRDSTRGSPRS